MARLAWVAASVTRLSVAATECKGIATGRKRSMLVASCQRRDNSLRFSDKGAMLAIVVALALLSILANGYQFGVADHNEQLPIIKRILDKGYLQQDWFVNVTAGFSVRSMYALVMAGLSYPFRMDVAFLLVYVAALLALAVAVFLCASVIWDDPAIGLIASLIVLYNRGGSLGGSQLMANMLLPCFVAYSIVLVAAYNLLRGRYGRSAILLGAAGLVHPLIGSEAAAMLAIAAVASAARSDMPLVLRKVSWILLVAAGTALLGYAAQRGKAGVTSHAEVVDILAWVRHPWHYVPFTWDMSVWEGFIAFGVLVGIARIGCSGSRFLDWVIVTVFALCAIGTAALVVDILGPLVKLQTFRMTVLLQVAGALYLSRYCWKELRSSRWLNRLRGLVLLSGIVFAQSLPHLLSALALGVSLSCMMEAAGRDLGQSSVRSWLAAAPLVALGGYSLALALNGKLSTDQVTVGAALFGIIVVSLMGAGCHSTRCHGSLSLLCMLTSGAVVLLLVIAWMGVEVPPALAGFAKSLRMHLDYGGHFGELALWVRSNTPADAVFLVPPHTQEFRLKAERAIVVDFKAFPFAESAVLEWRDRIRDCTGGGSLPLRTTWSARYAQLREAYGSLGTGELVRVAGKYGASYIVTEKPHVLNLPLAYENKGYQLYSIPTSTETAAAGE